jgi:hypothetical protein
MTDIMALRADEGLWSTEWNTPGTKISLGLFYAEKRRLGPHSHL